jgi:hypothetical protein
MSDIERNRKDGDELKPPDEPGSDERLSDEAHESLSDAPETVPAVPEGEDDDEPGERPQRGSNGEDDEPEPQPA